MDIFEVLHDYWFKLLCLAAAVFVGMYWADAHRYVYYQGAQGVLDTRTGMFSAPRLTK